MKIVGGTYDEIVVNPESNEIFGSGFRAAAALRLRDSRPSLTTALDAGMNEEAQMVAYALGIEIEGIIERDERVGFRYMTPISPPSINGPSSRIRELATVEDTTVLMFGLIEDPSSTIAARADVLVLDPQRPRDVEPLTTERLHAREIFVVANTTEMAKLGRSQRPKDAATNLLNSRPEITGTVTKRGASGCLVSLRDGTDVVHVPVGAHPTAKVWPIGSGDTFSAALAHAIDAGADLVQAARVGSAAAAHWCSTRDPAVPRTLLDGDTASLPRAADPAKGTVYLAGPFFSVGERWLVEVVRDELRSLGVYPWSPVHEVGPGGPEVAAADLEGLRKSDAVIALLDHADPGTVFEVGWAVREGIPVIGFASSFDAEGAKMMAGTTVELHRDLSTACYRAAWAAMGLRPVPGWAT